jgi:hypothetical protein
MVKVFAVAVNTSNGLVSKSAVVYPVSPPPGKVTLSKIK